MKGGDVIIMTIDNEYRFTLRMPAKLGTDLERYAKATNRSRASIAVEALRLYFADKIYHCSMDELIEREMKDEKGTG